MTFTLLSPAPQVKRSSRGLPSEDVPVFEPLQESLPLQSGYYSFVIDAERRFRVKRGSTRSHAAMAPNRLASSAGHFRVNRLGRVVEVVCKSTDFPFFAMSAGSDYVNYVTVAFRLHAAFNLHPRAVFTFSKARFEQWSICADGSLLDDPTTVLKQITDEESDDSDAVVFPPNRSGQFLNYKPTPPPALHHVWEDQSIVALEGDESDFCEGPSAPPLTPNTCELRSGKNNFVIDADGWLIVGMTGHHILSGGHDVGGAGHIYLGTWGQVTRVELNFSGHYRPRLSGDYVRYVYWTIYNHPLLTLMAECTFAGRIFKDLEAVSHAVSFEARELQSNDPELDERIEYYYL